MTNDNSDVRRTVIGKFARVALKFWTGSGAARAWLMTALVFAFLLGQIASQVWLNLWNRRFFDALERKSVEDVWNVAYSLPLVLGSLVTCLCGVLITRLLLQVRWRESLSERLMGWWIADQRYYRMNFTAPELGPPEFRIADDVRLATEPVFEFALSFVGALLTAASFAAILWQVAGSAKVTLGGAVIEIPGYLAIFAVLYAIVTSLGAYYLGRPLVSLVSHKNEREARFRAELTRLRENAESIALLRGDQDELSSVRQNYAKVVSGWLAIVWRNAKISVLLNGNGNLFPLLPLLLVAPKYLAGELTLGAVTQVVSAFIAVQAALIWFVDKFLPLAEWYASAERVVHLTDALEEIDVGTVMEDSSGLSFGDSVDGAIHLEGVSIADKAGRVMINDASTTIAMGEKVMLGGESGSGKSTLIRALAGLWPWGSGRVLMPKDASIAFLPQRPYLPLGTLREALAYPHHDVALDAGAVEAAMRRCGLSYLVKRLDEPDLRWDQTLSGGERQRVAFCRLLLHKPQIIIMDEATSALDEESQHSLLSLLREDLSYATVISVGHRPGVEAFHDRKLTLERKPAGAEMMSRPMRGNPIWKVLALPARVLKGARREEREGA
jgi:putative ATP-binding cassette transporter